MDFKIGQKYKTRKGEVVNVLALNAAPPRPVLVQKEGTGEVGLRYEDGRDLGNGLNSPEDLVGEYVPLVECVALVRKTDGVLVGVKPPHNTQTDLEWAATITKGPIEAPNSGFRIVKLREVES